MDMITLFSTCKRQSFFFSGFIAFPYNTAQRPAIQTGDSSSQMLGYCYKTSHYCLSLFPSQFIIHRNPPILHYITCPVGKASLNQPRKNHHPSSDDEVEWLALSHIREISDSILGPEEGYSWFSSVPPTKFWTVIKNSTWPLPSNYTKVYPKVSGLAAWSESCKCYSSLPLGAVVSLFCESV
jgi:hypothetical protein